jgi:hypothetical protein
LARIAASCSSGYSHRLAGAAKTLLPIYEDALFDQPSSSPLTSVHAMSAIRRCLSLPFAFSREGHPTSSLKATPLMPTPIPPMITLSGDRLNQGQLQTCRSHRLDPVHTTTNTIGQSQSQLSHSEPQSTLTNTTSTSTTTTSVGGHPHRPQWASPYPRDHDGHP